MTKPEKPKKRIAVRNAATYDFNWVSKKVALDTFLAWCKATIPANAKDVTLELREDWEYDSCLTYLQLEWEEIINNPSYDKDSKKYAKKLAKWKKEQCQK